MFAFLKLLRPLNLVIIFLTMYIVDLFVVLPMGVENEGWGLVNEHRGTRLHFFLLVISTLFIAAAGNIINDYFDLRTDRINKPDEMIVARTIKRRVAMASHFILNLLAVLIAVYLVLQIGLWEILGVHLFTASVLWFYSLWWKRRFLIGNIAIAFVTALVPLLVGFFEMSNVFRGFFDPFEQAGIPVWNRHSPIVWVLSYAGLAFLSTLIREIQKDIADMEGDRAIGCTTLPLVIGVNKAKWGVQALSLLILMFIGWIYYSAFLEGPVLVLLYIPLLVMMPVLVSMIRTARARERSDFLQGSKWMKTTMATALGFAIVHFFYGL